MPLRNQSLIKYIILLAIYTYFSSNLRAEEVKEGNDIEHEFHGYADLHFQWFDFGANQNREKGSQKDRRAAFDANRFSLTHETHFANGMRLEAEIEFEHGGTGSTLELEYEEAGEFESDVEKGGEVYLEELNIKKTFAHDLSIETGLIKVAVGQTTVYSHPSNYLATTRPESEEHIIPTVWTEMGISLEKKFNQLATKFQIVNGLDSTGFSSSHWIARGHQKRFETKKATDLAYVLRLDYQTENWETGVSAYYGDNSRNRPKADFTKDCETTDEEKIAPCGYISSRIMLTEAHFKFHQGPWQTQGSLLLGDLKNSDQVSKANSSLSNNLKAPKSPVAKQAYYAWMELGYQFKDILNFDADETLIPYLRYQRYDSMYKVEDSTADNPRFDRKMLTMGVGYYLGGYYILRGDISQRTMGQNSNYNNEHTLTISNVIYF